MRNIKNVQSTVSKVKALELNVDTVYLRSNISKIAINDVEMWQYDEMQMTFREFEEYNANKIQVLENDNADFLIDGVTKDVRINTLEKDLADLTLVIGGI